MKWPTYIAVVRHGESEFNKLKKELEQDKLWAKFLKEYKKDINSVTTRALAWELLEKFPFQYSDYDTPLTALGLRQAVLTGVFLKNQIEIPDVVITSPYLRCRQTFKGLETGWPELSRVQFYTDEFIAERDVGLRGLYLHWRIFYVYHPEQKKLYDSKGYYQYRFPQGENIPDVRLRLRKFNDTLIREFADKRVLLVTHHQTILADWANRERMSPEEFLVLDKSNPPKNCSFTLYRGYPELGKDGKLILEKYNEVCI
ncbi:histidine phosphatase family protein [Candidatus Giovannonibacteria bacterium]|nr:histidine phosphatase family protein [Candidatus Giovannonibacteria bacterium]